MAVLHLSTSPDCVRETVCKIIVPCNMPSKGKCNCCLGFFFSVLLVTSVVAWVSCRYTLGDIIIWSPAEFVSSLTFEELNSPYSYGSLILIKRERLSIRNPRNKNTFRKSCKLQICTSVSKIIIWSPTTQSEFWLTQIGYVPIWPAQGWNGLPDHQKKLDNKRTTAGVII